MQQQQQQGGRSNFPQGGAGTPPNPNAPAFAPPGGGPGAQNNNNNNRPGFGTGPAALRGLSSGIPAPGSRLPRGGPSNIGGPSGIGRGGAQPAQGLHIQGAANAGGRGGQLGGLPRGGGSAIGRGRGNGRGGPAGNQGVKRGLDGAPGGGDEKRLRPGAGGGPSN